MRKIAWSAAISMMLLTGFLVTKLIILGDVKLKENHVYEINIDEPNKAHILHEMGEFLEGIELINKAIITKDNAFLSQAAENSGGLDFTQAPKGLLRPLPIAFKKMGASSRLAFDEMVESHKDKVDTRLLEKQLTSMLDNCNKCHKEYDFKQNLKENKNGKELFVENNNTH